MNFSTRLNRGGSKPDRRNKPVFLFMLSCLVLLATASCSKPHEHHEQLLVFGTLVDITVYDAEEAITNKASQAITEELNHIHQTWHAWQPSTLTTINKQLAAGKSVSISQDSTQLLRQAYELSAASQGLFNPAIGELIALWGFHSDDAPGGPPPANELISDLLAKNPDMKDLEFKADQLSSSNPAVQLDLGAFAKGYAVDRAIEILLELGITDAIINAGGDLRAIGRHGDRPWRIGIRDPRKGGILASLETHGDESVFTSGNYERYFDYEGKRYHHIIDPRTGYPANKATSVTVIHSNAATADVAATALFVAGPEQWQDVAAKMNLDYVMLVDIEENIYMTPAMSKRIEIESEAGRKVIVSSIP